MVTNSLPPDEKTKVKEKLTDNNSLIECNLCQYYDVNESKCKKGNKCKTDFSKCNDYLINEKFIMF